MQYKKIIPCLDIKEGRVVKGVNFVNFRDAGDPVETAVFYDQEKADEIVLLDITATQEKRKTFIDIVRKVKDKVSLPFSVGGGINSLEDARALLEAGASKVSINTAAVENPCLIKQISETFGKHSLIVAVDVKKVGQEWMVMTRGGFHQTQQEAFDWVCEVEELGAGAILLTSMDADGTKDGYDIHVTKKVASLVNIPVIASGGAGTQDHFLDVFQHTKAQAALAATVFHYGELRVPVLRDFLISHHIPMQGAS